MLKAPQLTRTLLTLALASVPAASAASLMLGAGQSTTLNSTKVTLLRVTDSRCPLKAICVMAGHVKASLFIVKATSARLYTVYLPGVPVQTTVGRMILKAATRRESGAPQRLTFEVAK
ncbi:hypothetical protein GCM10010840_30950 [Deinococcus aerolatus]|uniref:Uncharacterized protein n=1 Tax=Deinococcus aerolatus TaxID=522487 RepID=A0ABQ2GDZ9_9DEIO|nr:hypothetical protein [Deinococcus aerolatus]GGL90707.1 hypothetical protein GCM10010840_30950 [Deinococcus aerolatus]